MTTQRCRPRRRVLPVPQTHVRTTPRGLAGTVGQQVFLIRAPQSAAHCFGGDTAQPSRPEPGSHRAEVCLPRCAQGQWALCAWALSPARWGRRRSSGPFHRSLRRHAGQTVPGTPSFVRGRSRSPPHEAVALERPARGPHTAGNTSARPTPSLTPRSRPSISTRQRHAATPPTHTVEISAASGPVRSADHHGTQRVTSRPASENAARLLVPAPVPNAPRPAPPLTC